MTTVNMPGSRKFCQRVYNFDVFFCFVFLVDEERDNPNTAKRRPSLARQRNAKWRFPGGSMMAQH